MISVLPIAFDYFPNNAIKRAASGMVCKFTINDLGSLFGIQELSGVEMRYCAYAPFNRHKVLTNSRIVLIRLFYKREVFPFFSDSRFASVSIPFDSQDLIDFAKRRWRDFYFLYKQRWYQSISVALNKFWFFGVSKKNPSLTTRMFFGELFIGSEDSKKSDFKDKTDMKMHLKISAHDWEHSEKEHIDAIPAGTYSFLFYQDSDIGKDSAYHQHTLPLAFYQRLVEGDLHAYSSDTPLRHPYELTVSSLEDLSPEDRQRYPESWVQ